MEHNLFCSAPFSFITELYGILYSMRLPSVLSQHRILGGAAILALTQLGASIAGLLRDRLLAQVFPDLAVVDAYIAAFRPSDLLFQVLVMSAIGMILVPLLVREHHRDDHDGVGTLLGAAMGLGGLLFGALALFLTVALPLIAPWLVNFQGEQLSLYIDFARLALLSNFFMVFGNTLGQELVTRERYWVYGITPIVYTLGTIMGTVLLTPWIGPYGPIVGTVAGAGIYAAWRLLAVSRLGITLHLRLWHPAIKEMGWMMLPRILALGALHVRLLLFDTMTSSLPTGAVTINAYARNVQSVVVGVIGIALAQAIFSPMSQAAVQGNKKKFRYYLERGSLVMLLLTIPSAAFLALIPDTIAGIVNLHHVASTFASVLVLYTVSIPIESLSYLFIRAFFALQNTRLPAIAHVANAIVAIALSWFLLPMYGLLAIPIGFIVGHMVQLLILWMFLPKRSSH